MLTLAAIHEDWTVGCLCALSIELAAAQEVLDEENEELDCDTNDDKVYPLD